LRYLTKKFKTMSRYSLCFIFALIHTYLAAPSLARSSSCLKTLYTFSSGTWIENLAIHSPSTILLSQLIPNGALYTFDPLAPLPSPSLIHAFSNTTNLLGITQYGSSSYAFISLDYNLTSGVPLPGSQALWALNLASSPPEVTKLLDLPKAGLLNGIATLSTNPPRVLISDSILGAIWLIDIQMKDAIVVLQDNATMLPGLNAEPAVGINGLRYDAVEETVVYTNTAKGILARIKVDPQTGAGKGSYDVLSTQVLGADDFGLTKGWPAKAQTLEEAYVAGHATNQLWRVVVEGGKAVMETVANVTMPTSARVGTGEKGEVVYITTAGGEILEYTPFMTC
jgi:hypothetical protein